MLVEDLRKQAKIVDGVVQIESDVIRDFLATAPPEEIKKIEPKPCGGCGGGKIR